MEATLNKNENYTWKFVKKPGNIMDFSHCGKMGMLQLELYVSCFCLSFEFNPTPSCKETQNAT